MMKLELRNTRTSKSVFIDPRGAVFGREGGDADVKLADQGVSKKHARIYARKGEWFLEDLNSANGTYVDDQRLAEPLALAPGIVFTLSRQQFEVVQMVDEPDDVTHAPKEEEADESGEEFQETVPPQPAARKSSPPARASAPPAAAPRARAEAPAPERKARSAAREDEVPDEEEVPAGFDLGYFMKAVPKAVAYYLAAIPLLLVNPVGFVRKGIDDQKVPPMGTMQLIAYAFPPLLVTMIVGTLAAAIVGLVHGASIGVILPIVPLVINVVVAAVSAAVTGFIWHPVLTWIVDKLQGQSDARSRSNYFAMTMTAVAVTSVAPAIGLLFTLIPFTIMALVPVLLSLVATIIVLFVAYSWFKFFDVVKWFQMAVLGLGALAVLGTAFSSLGIITASIRGIGSGTQVTATSTADAQEALAKAQAAQRKAEVAQRAAQKGARAEAPKEAKAEVTAPEPAAVQPAVAVSPGKVEPVAAEVKPEKAPAAEEKPPAEKPAAEKPIAAPAPAGALTFPEYKARLAALEKAVEDDPTILQRDGVLPLYQQLYRARFDAEAKAKAEERRQPPRSHPSQAYLNARLRDAEVYKATSDLVQKVHQKVFGD